MHPKTIFSKTAKGVLEVKNKTISLPRELGLVFLAVDGKSPVADLPQKARMDPDPLSHALEKLLADGYIKVVYEAPAAGKAAAPAAAEMEDLDFTSPAKVAELNSEAGLRAKAEAAAKARAETATRAAAEAKGKQEAETRARAAAEATANQEAAAKLKAEAAARAAAQASAEAQLEANAATEAKAKAEAQARMRAAMEAKANADAEAQARAAAEAKARKEAEDNQSSRSAGTVARKLELYSDYNFD